MAYERPGESPLDYQQCRYGNSKLLFRGPKKDTKETYLAFIGGTETYGKYIEHPFPALVEEQLDMPCLNFGSVNASVDAFVNDDSVLGLASKAKLTIVQATGAHNLSNRFYSVHPRRNDRFLKASTLMQTIFRDVDFTDFSFTRHMLTTLMAISPDRFEVVSQELKSAWVARMQLMLSKISGRVILLWVSEQAPEAEGKHQDLGPNPLFVDLAMIEAVRGMVSEYVEVVVPPEIISCGTEGMLYPQLEAAAASEMYGPLLHELIAKRLLEEI